MARPKKKLFQGSTQTFSIGRGVLGDPMLSTGAGEDDAAFLLAIHRSLRWKAFLEKDSSKLALAEFQRQAREFVPPNAKPHADAASSEKDKEVMGQAQLGFMYAAMVWVVASPGEALQDNRAGTRWLRFMLTHHFDFTLEMLTLLRHIFVQEQPAIERAILALRLRKDVTDSFGKLVGFDGAQYKEIQSAYGMTKKTWGDAVAYLDDTDNRR